MQRKLRVVRNRNLQLHLDPAEDLRGLWQMRRHLRQIQYEDLHLLQHDGLCVADLLGGRAHGQVNMRWPGQLSDPDEDPLQQQPVHSRWQRLRDLHRRAYGDDLRWRPLWTDQQQLQPPSAVLDDVLGRWPNLRRWRRVRHMWLHCRRQEPDVRDQLRPTYQQLRAVGRLRRLHLPEHMRRWRNGQCLRMHS